MKSYRKDKLRIKRIDQRTDYLCRKDVPVVSGKVVGSSSGFPYTEVRTTVQMYEPIENDAVNGEIRKLAEERYRLQKKVDEVEEYIAVIGDSELNEIFQLAFIQGRTLQEIGDTLGYTKGRISQKISDYLKD